MTSFYKHWAAEKARFEKATGLKKPRDAEKGLSTAFGKHTGMTDRLKGCDQASAAFEAALDAYRAAMAKQYVQLSKAAKAYFSSAEAFDKASSSYQKVLADAFLDRKNKAEYNNELHILFGALISLKSDVLKERQRLAEQLLEHKPL